MATAVSRSPPTLGTLVKWARDEQAAWERLFPAETQLPTEERIPRGIHAMRYFDTHRIQSQDDIVDAFRQFCLNTPLDSDGTFRCIFTHNPEYHLRVSFERGIGRAHREEIYFSTLELPHETPLQETRPPTRRRWVPLSAYRSDIALLFPARIETSTNSMFSQLNALLEERRIREDNAVARADSHRCLERTVFIVSIPIIIIVSVWIMLMADRARGI